MGFKNINPFVHIPYSFAHAVQILVPFAVTQNFRDSGPEVLDDKV